MNYLEYNNNIMNWKDKFIIAWLNKKADINSKYQQLLEQINQLQDENKKLQLIKLLNIIKSICSNIENKYQDETLDFLFNKSKKDENLLKNENNLKYTLSHALDNIKTYFLMKEKNIKGLPNFLRNIENFIELENIVNNFSKELEKYSNKVSGEILNISQNYKKAEFNDINGNYYEIFKIPQSNKQKHIDALRVLAHGRSGYQNGIFDEKNAEGRWCVLREDMANYYLSQDDFYVVYKNGKVFAGLGNQNANCVNRINEPLNIYEWSILLKPFLNIDKELIENKFPNKYKDMLLYVKKEKKSGELWFEKNIANNTPELINFCIENNIRFKPKEKEILKYIADNNLEGIEYVTDILKKRVPQNEIGNKIEKLLIIKYYYSSIYDDEKNIFEKYMENVNYYSIRNKLKNLELKIYEDGLEAHRYAINIIRGRWPQDTDIGKIAEKQIFQIDNLYKFFQYAKYLNYDEVKNETKHIEEECLKRESPDCVYRFAKDYIKNRWPQNKNGIKAEEKIIQVPYYSCEYAAIAFIDENGQKGARWPQNEEIGQLAEIYISEDPLSACFYAINCIKDRWPQNEEIGRIAEMNIAKNYQSAYEYALYCIKDRWPQDTEAGKIAEMNIAQSEKTLSYKKYQLLYPMNVLVDKNGQKGARWPQDTEAGKIAEMNIAQNGLEAFDYAINCIKDRWPQDTEAGKIAEMNIAQNGLEAFDYAINCIKDRWPQNEEIGRIAEKNIKEYDYYYWNDYCKKFNIKNI